jgi:hypothetical protein
MVAPFSTRFIILVSIKFVTNNFAKLEKSLCPELPVYASIGIRERSSAPAADYEYIIMSLSTLEIRECLLIRSDRNVISITEYCYRCLHCAA